MDSILLVPGCAGASRSVTPPADSVPDEGSLVLEQRFAIVPEWVIDADLSDAAFRLYAVLLRYGQSSGARMPSRAVLAARLRKRSVDTVDRALKELVALGAVVVERRRRGRENLTNRYFVMSTPPGGRARGGRTDAATAVRGAGGRRVAAGGGRTDAGTLAASVRPDPGVSTQQQPSPASPALGSLDVAGLAADCRSVRHRLGLPISGWTTRSVDAALHQAIVESGRPVAVAVRALLAVAADPATRSPGRLVCAGPWWDVAQVVVRPDADVRAVEELAGLEARLVEADGRRVWAQRRARQELAARGEPVTRLSVARLAVRFLQFGEGSGGPEQVPAVAGDVEEDGDPAVGLGAGLFEEADAGGAHPVVGGGAVLDPQEEPDPAGVLVADGGRLFGSVGLGQQQSGRGAGRPDDDPPLGAPAVAGQGGGVLDQVEAEGVGEEGDRRVVVLDDHADGFEVHAVTLRPVRPGGEAEVPEAGARYASANRMPRGAGRGNGRPGAVGSSSAVAGAGR
jgi:hypothetical protein